MKLLIDLGEMPIAHRMLTSSNDDEEVFGMALYTCCHCGLSQIAEPIDPGILYNGFNFNFSSWKPEPHFDDELDVIFETNEPETAFEIGCNDGRFLEALRERGVTNAMGVEPNPVPGEKAKERGFHVFSEMVSTDVCERAIAANGSKKFDLVVSRQVLEHVLDLDNFFACANQLLSEDGFLFIDVPDCEQGIEQGDCSIIWEEHVSYFSEAILIAAFRQYGFEPKIIRHYNFSGGTIAIIAQKSNATTLIEKTAASGLGGKIEAFQSQAIAYQKKLAAGLQDARRNGTKIVLYGTGCRACTVVNALKLGGLIDYAIDDQTERQELFMPGSRLPIYAPSIIKEIGAPFICLLAVNNENEMKVKAKLEQAVGTHAVSISLLGPLDINGELSAINEVIAA